MGALKKLSHGLMGRGEGGQDGAHPPEALSYDSDITEEAVAQLQQRADAILEQDEWAVIDGYVGSK